MPVCVQDAKSRCGLDLARLSMVAARRLNRRWRVRLRAQVQTHDGGCVVRAVPSIGCHEMIWTRRGFLKLLAVSTVGATLVEWPTPLSAIESSAARLGPSSWPSLVSLLGSSLDGGLLSIGRPGSGIIFKSAIAPDSHYAWHAAPGGEIVVRPDGLENLSSGDVLLRRVAFRWEGHMYVVNDGSDAIPFDASAPPCPLRLILSPSLTEPHHDA